MKFVFNIALSILLFNNSACSQPAKEKLVGSWSLVCDVCEFGDLIILRSDHQYFIYNPQNADIGSVEMFGTLKDNDLIIDSGYTSMVEKGVWNYDRSKKELILKKRNILEDWTSFSETYGKSSELRLNLDFLPENELELCFDGGKEQLCEKYAKARYYEITEGYTGAGIQTEEILLSGYETELKLSYDFYKEPNEVVIEDVNGEELFSTDMTSTNGMKTVEIPLRGVTKLVLKVNGQQNSKFRVRIEIK
jgi:hypothetical protein